MNPCIVDVFCLYMSKINSVSEKVPLFLVQNGNYRKDGIWYKSQPMRIGAMRHFFRNLLSSFSDLGLQLNLNQTVSH